MNIRIKRVDPEVSLPEYKTPGSAAMDCYVREETTIPARSIGYVPLNFSLSLPPGHFVMMAARSSLHKQGLMFANGVAVFDQDFAGDGDEYKAILLNFTDTPVTIKRGDRISQIVALPYDKVVWDEVTSLGNPDRGGIGSTGI
jgi:dUTP pyrophosphatase